jgi:hypothetical protein
VSHPVAEAVSRGDPKDLAHTLCVVLKPMERTRFQPGRHV